LYDVTAEREMTLDRGDKTGYRSDLLAYPGTSL
jgi:hypothetical protein